MADGKAQTDARVHPYKSQPPRAFWRQTVEGRGPFEVGDWYVKRFEIGERKIATAGSCFAQHIGRRMRASGFSYLDVEPAPDMLPPRLRGDYGYEIYSARYGNVYTARQLIQLAQRALGEYEPTEGAWRSGAGWVDPFRPTLEPAPFESEEEVRVLRDYHLAAVRRLLESTGLFVFTLGMTETWIAREDGAAYPVAPGVSGGIYDPQRYCLLNQDYEEVLADMRAFIEGARSISGDMHFLLTVSPVPLAATATDDQVVVASTYSKSVLRAVAGKLKSLYPFVDYFPSYEIISSAPSAGAFYASDLREVHPTGVDHAMKQFFSQHQPRPAPGGDLAQSASEALADDEEVKCDEELLVW
jgi:hypothetical protein